MKHALLLIPSQPLLVLLAISLLTHAVIIVIHRAWFMMYDS